MMARAWRIAWITLGCGALVFAAPGTDAVSLGKAELRSRLGEPLEARIPLTADPGEALRGTCFSLLTAPQGSLAAIGTHLELRHHAHGADLYVRSRAPLNDREVAFAITLPCTGALGADPARYSFALSVPAPASVPTGASAGPSPAASPPARDRGAALPVVARLPARSGDTLASIAHAIFPGNAEARQRYIAAMRRQNAALSTLGDDQPIAQGTRVALPDLHAFAATMPAPRAPELAAATPNAAPRPSSRVAPRITQALSSPRTGEPPRARAASAGAQRDEPASSARTAAAAGGRASVPRSDDGFQLRLSAPVMDLSPSAGMDERRRAELRARLLVLDADDRTAAMLAMRENIRRLESQVSALKLKLAELETAPLARPQAPAPKPEVAAPAPKAATSAPASTPQAPAPKAEIPAPAPRPQAPSAKPEAPAPAPVAKPQPAPAVAKAEPAPVAKSEPPSAAKPAPLPPEKSATAAAPSRATAHIASPQDRHAEGDLPWYLNRMLLAILATILIVVWVLLRARVRSAEEPEIIQPPTEVPESTGAGSAIPDTGAPTTEPHDAGAEPAAATRVPAEDHAELRRRYMEERFPEIVNGTLVLEDERSVVKAARLLYEDGTAPRAIELLQFAIEQDAEALHPWLALFEIFRLEKLEGEFGRLAARFSERHGATDEWRKVRSVGRSLDPGNPLYQGTEYGAPADPEAEGWLRSPSDDAGRALAGELRAKLLSEAGVKEADLRDDPTPALRKAEIFSLA
jgi:pilus assembly protein FimV